MTQSHPGPAAPASPPQSFRYEAQTLDGKILRGTLEAPTAAHVNAQLSSLSLRVLVVESTPAGGAPRRPPLGPDDFLLFNQQLAHLTAAGLPVERGLRIIAADMKKGRLASAARDVAADLEKGTPLSDAFARHASRFPPLYSRLVEAGVKAGNLPGMLFNLGHHLELVAKLKQSLWRTLSYPAMILIAISLVFLFVSLAVFPQFAQMYAQYRITLPVLTHIIFALGEVYPKILAVLAGGILILILLASFFRITGSSGVLSDKLLSIPIIGPVLRASLLARWIDALRLSVDAGLDLPRACELASAATASPRLTKESRDLADLLVSGRPAELFTGRLIPQTVPASIELATLAGGSDPQSSELQSTLATLARMYQQQAEHRLRLVPALITPFALLFVAFSVMITIAGLFLPLMKIIRAVSSGDFDVGP